MPSLIGYPEASGDFRNHVHTSNMRSKKVVLIYLEIYFQQTKNTFMLPRAILEVKYQTGQHYCVKRGIERWKLGF